MNGFSRFLTIVLGICLAGEPALAGPMSSRSIGPSKGDLGFSYEALSAVDIVSPLQQRLSRLGVRLRARILRTAEPRHISPRHWIIRPTLISLAGASWLMTGTLKAHVLLHPIFFGSIALTGAALSTSAKRLSNRDLFYSGIALLSLASAGFDQFMRFQFARPLTMMNLANPEQMAHLTEPGTIREIIHHILGFVNIRHDGLLNMQIFSSFPLLVIFLPILWFARKSWPSLKSEVATTEAIGSTMWVKAAMIVFLSTAVSSNALMRMTPNLGNDYFFLSLFTLLGKSSGEFEFLNWPDVLPMILFLGAGMIRLKRVGSNAILRADYTRGRNSSKALQSLEASS